MFEKKIIISKQNNVSKIYFENNFSKLDNLIENKNIVIISDTNLYNLYKPFFKNFPIILLEPGENAKSFSNIENIISKLLYYNVDKSFLILAIGGGSVCDITAFVASIYKRGINFALVPTTILAQIDAAIGGKTATNFLNLKNCIGTFNLAEFVFSCPIFFNTLTKIEIKSAFGEILKYSLISKKLSFYKLYKKNLKYFEKNITEINEIIIKCIKIKSEIVKKDFLDKNIRHILNFGHSFGHCFEIIENLPHGIAVVKGMSVAIDLSYKLNYINKEKQNLLKKYIEKYEFDTKYTVNQEHINLLFHDKKKNNNEIELVLLKDIACPIIVKIEKNLILEILNDNKN